MLLSNFSFSCGLTSQQDRLMMISSHLSLMWQISLTLILQSFSNSQLSIVPPGLTRVWCEKPGFCQYVEWTAECVFYEFGIQDTSPNKDPSGSLLQCFAHWFMLPSAGQTDTHLYLDFSWLFILLKIKYVQIIIITTHILWRRYIWIYTPTIWLSLFAFIRIVFICIGYWFFLVLMEVMHFPTISKQNDL